MDDPYQKWRGPGHQVRCASGQTFIVVASPWGVPLRYNEGGSIIGFLVWQTYMGVVEVFARGWKVAVFRRVGGRCWKRDHVIYRETISHGVSPVHKLEELEDRCREGAFDS